MRAPINYAKAYYFAVKMDVETGDPIFIPSKQDILEAAFNRMCLPKYNEDIRETSLGEDIFQYVSIGEIDVYKGAKAPEMTSEVIDIIYNNFFNLPYYMAA